MQDKKRNKLQKTDIEQSQDFDEDCDEDFDGFTSLEEIYNSEEFDEEDDIVLPNSHLGELFYILFILRDITRNPKNLSRKFGILKNQIRVYSYLMKVK